MEVMKIVRIMMIMMMMMNDYGNGGVGKAEGVTCKEVVPSLSSCLAYVAGPDERPSAPCYFAASELNKKADSTQARRFLCGCLKEATKFIGVNPEKSKQLPQLCGIQIIVPLDPNIDCSSIP